MRASVARETDASRTMQLLLEAAFSPTDATSPVALRVLCLHLRDLFLRHNFRLLLTTVRGPPALEANHGTSEGYPETDCPKTCLSR